MAFALALVASRTFSMELWIAQLVGRYAGGGRQYPHSIPSVISQVRNRDGKKGINDADCISRENAIFRQCHRERGCNLGLKKRTG